MKAPEKLYLRKGNKLPLEVVGDKWYETDPQYIYGSVEYLRTDAFIEKLECWLNENGREYYGEFDEGFLIEFNNSEKAIENFRKYIKGE